MSGDFETLEINQPKIKYLNIYFSSARSINAFSKVEKKV